MQGKIVSISGFDGVGKTTQIKRIIENLKKKDSAITLFDVIKEDTYTSYQDIKTIKKIFSMYKYVSVRFFLSGPETKRLQQKVLNGKEDIFSRITLIEKLCEFEKRDSTICLAILLSLILNGFWKKKLRISLKLIDLG